MRFLRTLLLGGGVALLPFLLVLAFTWARDGRAAGAVALLGRGELLPAASLLSAQALAAIYGAPTPARASTWTIQAMVAWIVITLSCAVYPLPYAGGAGYEERLVGISTVAFVFGVATHLAATGSARGGRGP